MQIVKLNEHKSALIILGSTDNDADRIIKVLRSSECTLAGAS